MTTNTTTTQTNAQMTTPNGKKRRVLPTSIFYALLILIFPVAAGVIVTIMEMDSISTPAILIQAGFTFLSAAVGIALMAKSSYSLKEYGFTGMTKQAKTNAAWFLPLLAVEAFSFLPGFRENLSMGYVLAVVLFTLMVGINEEVYFRGLILKRLSEKGIRYAAIVSSVLFSVVHLVNVVSGADLTYTGLQIVFAALFGFVCAELVILTKSLIPVILWHFIHDCIGYVTVGEITMPALISVIIQIVLMLAYSVYLWKKIKKVTVA
ncbi:CPBP family intramembrane glutamic endopeptidase [Paenibacillus sp. CAU 1782]